MTLAAAFDSRTMWYVTRATGVVSLLLLTATVVLGVTEVVRWANHRWPRFVTAGLHKNLSLLATAFIAAHVATTVVDGFAPIGWLDAVVPFHSPYRRLWLGLGTVAVDLLVALVVTSLLRHRIGQRAWRLVHWAAYACWPVALLHGLGTGTDAASGWFVSLAIGCLAVVALAVWWRIASGWPAQQGRRVAAAMTSALVPVLIAMWAFAGPLQPGWARRAGTPAALLGSGATASDTGGDAVTVDPPSTAAPAAFGESFDATLNGTVDESGGPREETITIDGRLDGGSTAVLHIVLQGRAVDGGVSLETSQVTLTPSDGSTPFAGAVSQLNGPELVADLHRPDGSRLRLQADLQLDDNHVDGTVHGEPA